MLLTDLSGGELEGYAPIPDKSVAFEQQSKITADKDAESEQKYLNRAHSKRSSTYICLETTEGVVIYQFTEASPENKMPKHIWDLLPDISILMIP